MALGLADEEKKKLVEKFPGMVIDDEPSWEKISGGKIPKRSAIPEGWSITMTKPWLATLAPDAKPVFKRTTRLDWEFNQEIVSPEKYSKLEEELAKKIAKKFEEKMGENFYANWPTKKECDAGYVVIHHGNEIIRIVLEDDEPSPSSCVTATNSLFLRFCQSDSSVILEAQAKDGRTLAEHGFTVYFDGVPWSGITAAQVEPAGYIVAKVEDTERVEQLDGNVRIERVRG